MVSVLEVIKDLWKGFILVVLGIALLTSSFLIPFHSFLPAWMHQDDECSIGPRERRSISVNLVLGSVVRGMLVTWGGDNCIVFSVEDSVGNIVLEERVIRDRYFFEFQPSKSDSYVLVLNNIDGSAERGVYWIVWSYYYNFLFLLLGVALYLVGVFVMFREEKTIRSKFADELEEASKAVQRRACIVLNHLLLVFLGLLRSCCDIYPSIMPSSASSISSDSAAAQNRARHFLSEVCFTSFNEDELYFGEFSSSFVWVYFLRWLYVDFKRFFYV